MRSSIRLNALRIVTARMARKLARHRGGAEHGISDTIAPMNALIGVFLSDQRPDRNNTPRPLDYRAIRRDTNSFSPQLKQVFFIGDGTTSSGCPSPKTDPNEKPRIQWFRDSRENVKSTLRARPEGLHNNVWYRRVPLKDTEPLC